MRIQTETVLVTCETAIANCPCELLKDGETNPGK